MIVNSYRESLQICNSKRAVEQISTNCPSVTQLEPCVQHSPVNAVIRMKSFDDENWIRDWFPKTTLTSNPTEWPRKRVEECFPNNLQQSSNWTLLSLFDTSFWCIVYSNKCLEVMGLVTWVWSQKIGLFKQEIRATLSYLFAALIKKKLKIPYCLRDCSCAQGEQTPFSLVHPQQNC